MSAATAIPAFSVQRDVAAGAGLRAVAEARAAGHRVTFTDVLLRAVGAAAAAEPSANAWLVDGEVLAFEQVGVALAVDTPDGVMGPVVRGVESAGLPEIAAARADLVARARSGALQARELTGATITLSNVAGLGAHGITPVLTAPQVCALGVGSARPAGAGSLVSVTFVGDHRALDGADGARFLAAFAAALDAVSPIRED
jgi:pyruvate dehydrogenase E2 component (dihydrolipoamide acetyltransferase)